MIATAPTQQRDWTLPQDGDELVIGGKRYYFSESAANHVIQFFRHFIKHTKGSQFSGRPFNLQPWQEWTLGELFGWRRENGTRRYRTAFLFVPRKNGKSEFGAAIANYMLIADGEAGAEVYAAAGEREQASIILTMAKRMIEFEPKLREVAEPLKFAIVCRESGSSFKALSSEADTKHGLSPHAALIDELHVHPNRDLYDVLITGMGARSQPMTFITTTAGFDKKSICYEVYEYAKGILNGTVEDASFLPVIFEAEEGDDWTDPATWEKANPNLGVSISYDFLEAECKKAQQIPGYENTFKRLYLNIWTEQATRWLPLEAWDRNAGEPVTLESLRDREAYIGLDMSSTRDITAMVAVLPKYVDGVLVFDVLCRFWVPGESIHLRSREDKVPYDVWLEKGLIQETAGRTTDQDAVKADILAWANVLDVREVVADRWNTSQLLQDLAAEHDMTVVEFGQGFASMNEPSKSLERLVLDDRLNHGGHEVLRWMAANVAIETDAAGNIKPSKKASKERIDGIVSLVMALGRALCHEDGVRDFDDEGRGLMVI